MQGIIWGSTKIIAENKLDNLVKEYETFWGIKPLKIRKSSQEYCVYFENNDIWRALECKENRGCGRRCHISLIDRKIPKELRWIPECAATTFTRPFTAIGYFN